MTLQYKDLKVFKYNSRVVLNTKYTTKIAKYTTQFLKDEKKAFAKYKTKIAKYSKQFFHDENCYTTNFF